MPPRQTLPSPPSHFITLHTPLTALKTFPFTTTTTIAEFIAQIQTKYTNAELVRYSATAVAAIQKETSTLLALLAKIPHYAEQDGQYTPPKDPHIPHLRIINLEWKITIQFKGINEKQGTATLYLEPDMKTEAVIEACIETFGLKKVYYSKCGHL